MQQEYDLEQLEEELSQIKNEVVEYDRTYRNKYNDTTNVVDGNPHQRIVILVLKNI